MASLFIASCSECGYDIGEKEDVYCSGCFYDKENLAQEHENELEDKNQEIEELEIEISKLSYIENAIKNCDPRFQELINEIVAQEL